MKRIYVKPATEISAWTEIQHFMAASTYGIIKDEDGIFKPIEGEVTVIDDEDGPPSTAKSFNLWDDDGSEW